jgi:hypothetical protein
MKERIHKLAEQADLYARSDNSSMIFENFQKRYTEKLVELIVQECMTTILKESKWYWDKDEFESSNAIQNAAMKVKEHFGVE